MIWSIGQHCHLRNRVIAEYVSSQGPRPALFHRGRYRNFPARARRVTANSRYLGGSARTQRFPIWNQFSRCCRSWPVAHFQAESGGRRQRRPSDSRITVENLPWKLDREIADFQSLDIGLYPIDARLYSDKWAAGKSGFKALQYMAAGVPYVATPVGAAAEIGEQGTTHFLARSNDEWQSSLVTLLGDAERRQRMGVAGRRHVTAHYGLPAQADKLAAALREAVQLLKPFERTMHNTSKFKLALLAGIAPLPSFLKRSCYRLFFGYRIGKRVRIGLSIIDAALVASMTMCRFGHLNVIIGQVVGDG